VSARECRLTTTPASYPHIQRPKTGERRILLPDLHRLCHPHYMFCIPLPSKHHAPPCNNRNRHCIVPSLHLLSGLFHQSFLGRTPARRSSWKEKLPEPRIGFPCHWNMDLHCHLHLAEIDAGSLHSGILWDLNYTRGTRYTGVDWFRICRHLCYCGGLMDRLDRVGEERDLATRGTIPTKILHGVVSLTIKFDATPPNQGVFYRTGGQSAGGFRSYSSCPLGWSPLVSGCGRRNRPWAARQAYNLLTYTMTNCP